MPMRHRKKKNREASEEIWYLNTVISEKNMFTLTHTMPVFFMLFQLNRSHTTNTSHTHSFMYLL